MYFHGALQPVASAAPSCTDVRLSSRRDLYLSTSPCPTRYPSVSNRLYARSLRSSSSSFSSESASSAASRWAMGTSSMSRKSRQLAFRKVACGSEALYGGRGVSKDIEAQAVAVRVTCALSQACPTASISVMVSCVTSVGRLHTTVVCKSLMSILIQGPRAYTTE